jgi:hypothetical protein
MPQSLRSEWTREKHRNLDDEEVEDEISDQGYGTIASWTHEATGVELEYRYNPDKDEPYEVVLDTSKVSHELEGRYETRTQGGNANKDLMEDVEFPEEMYPEEEEDEEEEKEEEDEDEQEDVEGPLCAGTTSDGEECQNEVDEEGAYCRYHQEQAEDGEAQTEVEEQVI